MVALGGPLPVALPVRIPLDIVGDLTARLEPGLTANAGPRYFRFVTGGSYPVAVAADWLVWAWDQNAALHIMSPAMSALEACTATWILDALGLPEQSSLNEVALNQVLAPFSSPSGENITNQVIAAVQAAGVCWCGGTMWAGEPAMRISVSNWRTSEDDIDRSAESILQAVERVRVG